ncbi:MAG TPA: hypothetical protein VFB38_08525 [Chthonomonadaceae bacterium]|nr:hypothetical protein [Chthonomonadaceae bacterium]
MNKVLSGPVIVGALVVVLLAIVVFGYLYLVGGRSNQRPTFSDPRMNRMYPMAPVKGASSNP